LVLRKPGILAGGSFWVWEELFGNFFRQPGKGLISQPGGG